MNLFRMPAISHADTAVRYEQNFRSAVQFNEDVEMEEEQQAQMSSFEESVKQ